MQSKLLFRADGNTQIGLGHFYRLIALYEMYKEDFHCTFLTKETVTLQAINPKLPIDTVEASVKTEQEPEVAFSNYAPSSTLIFLDGYQFSSSYQKALRDKGYKVVFLDDFVKDKMVADIVVNHSPNVTAEDYTAEHYTKFALGAKYVILRPPFLAAAKKEPHPIESKELFICFGGADALDLSYKAAKAAISLSEFSTIHIVVGAANTSNKINEIAVEHTKLVKVHRRLDATQMVSLIKQCNLAVVPASTTLYEVIAVKTPVLSGYYVANQRAFYKAMLAQNVIFQGDDLSKYSVTTFIEKLKNCIASTASDRQIKAQQKLIDGKSKMRFIGLLHRELISFRKATKEDVMRVYHWSNDPLVRKNSYNPAQITLTEHTTWFSSAIEDDSILFLIAEVNGKPAGVLRYTINKEHAVVGILVSKQYRGQGLAATILKKGAAVYFKKYKRPIYAYIKKENEASVASFKKANYRYFKDEEIKGSSSFVYRLDTNDE